MIYHLLTFLLLLFTLPFHALGKQNGIGLLPAMGWNSWNHFACDISEELIIETTDAIVNLGLNKLGYNYINLDDCWQSSQRDENGKVVPDSTRFPHGMKYVSDYVHSKGLKFGIYSSAGFKTCQGFPASLGLEELDAASYAEWGVDYLKYDNCYTDHSPPQVRFEKMSKALEQSGRDILFSLCEWGRENPSIWASELGNSWRVSGDIWDGWASILTRANIDSPLWRYAAPGGYNDPDMLEVGNGGCSDEEYRAHFSLWSMLKSPLLIGNDIRVMKSSDVAYEILTNEEVIAVNQDPLGWQARRIWSDVMEADPSDRLIATKCSKSNDQTQKDDPQTQVWYFQEDGTIKSLNTGNCLVETTRNNTMMENLVVGDYEGPFVPNAVGTTSCDSATKWKMGQFAGGSIVSQASGNCLEVATFEFYPYAEGKRIQTGKCQGFIDRETVDIRGHQSWTMPQGTQSKGTNFLNLYQRQCLTIDKDAAPGEKEIWSTPLSDGSIAVLMLNKGSHVAMMSLKWDQLGLGRESIQSIRDLWQHEDLFVPQKVAQLTLEVPSHGVRMLKVVVKA